MKVERTRVGPIGTNCYLLCDEAANAAAVIDPGAEPDKIRDMLHGAGLDVRLILLTHAHFDHTGALAAVKKATGAPVCLCGRDLPLLRDPQLPIRRSVGFPDIPLPPEPDRLLRDGDELPLGSLSIRVMETPGHTHGSVLFLAGNVIFSGDTIFRGDIGRTDTPAGDRREMASSLKRISALTGDYTIYPGHGPATTFAWERANNPYLRSVRA